MAANPIYITDCDLAELQNMVSSYRRSAGQGGGNLGALERELQRATIVDSSQMPGDVVTMNAAVRIRDLDSGEFERFTLVFPPLADWDSNRISVLAPVGIAVLGCRVGDETECPAPAGARRLRVEQVLDQPERSGCEGSCVAG